MDENNLSELEIEEDKQRIRLKKYDGQKPEIYYQPKVEKSEKTPQEKEDQNIKKITSPMVGTFYRASSPEAKPYVEVGQTCKKNDVVCIVEAMKVMNEIKTEVGGQITKILVENGESVEFGQALFEVKI